MISRRDFIAAASSVLLSQAAPASRLLMITAAEAKRMQDAAARTHPILATLAGNALKAGPWSVTFHRPQGVATAAGPNDYFSEGPYWWPNPANPNGPYIRKDGQRNPARFVANHNDMGTMSEAILALGMGAYLLDMSVCANHASEILTTWFVSPKTRMNPNLEYGQAIRGVTTGRGIGLIDTNSLIYAVQGIALLEAAGGVDAALLSSLRQWFSQFLHWMTTSRKGLDEKKAGNNHATWWAAKVAAFAAFVANPAAIRIAWDDYRDYLVPTEIQPNGSCPKEEARTNSLSYSAFNLDAFATLCRLAQIQGVDLWHFKTPRNISVQTAFDYLMPYVLHPDTWHHQQIGPFSPNGIVFPGLAGLGLPSQQLLSAYDRLSRANSPWVQFVDLLIKTSSR